MVVIAKSFESWIDIGCLFVLRISGYDCHMFGGFLAKVFVFFGTCARKDGGYVFFSRGTDTSVDGIAGA
jgi:hypothetical protein